MAVQHTAHDVAQSIRQTQHSFPASKLCGGGAAVSMNMTDVMSFSHTMPSMMTPSSFAWAVDRVAIGIDGRSRDGSRSAVPDETFKQSGGRLAFANGLSVWVTPPYLFSVIDEQLKVRSFTNTRQLSAFFSRWMVFRR